MRCETIAAMHYLQPKSGLNLTGSGLTQPNWLKPTDDFLREFLARPELAPLPESCTAELALNAALNAAPSKPVAPEELLALKDPDASESYSHFDKRNKGLILLARLEPATLQSKCGPHQPSQVSILEQ